MTQDTPSPSEPQGEHPSEEVVSSSRFSFPTGARRGRPGIAVSVEPEPPLTDPPPSPPPNPSVSAVRSPATPTAAQRDAGYYPLELLSGFVFYPFKTLSVTQVRGKHQAKFAMAHKRGETRLSVDAVTALLGDGVNAADLTVPDFFFTMYWLRLHCAGSAPLKVRGMCSAPEHVLAVAEKRKPSETLVTVDIVNHTRLKESVLDPKAVEEFLQRPEVAALTDLGYRLTAPRMADSIELEEKWQDKDSFAEVEFLADFASSIVPLDGRPATLEERIHAVGEMDSDMISLLRDWQEVIQSYGVEEFVKFKCKECGAEIEAEVSVSASDFL